MRAAGEKEREGVCVRERQRERKKKSAVAIESSDRALAVGAQVASRHATNLCCSVLQCVAVCHRSQHDKPLQHTATHCDTLQHTAT